MASSLTDIQGKNSIERIWYGCLCIEFNSDYGLSQAEFRVISLLLKGYNSGQIAAFYSRSVKTISAQKGRAFKRLGVRNDATLLPALLLQGMVTVYTDLNREHSLDDNSPDAE
ncbi:helix-turn-helix transcriptional regulator [Salmonella enterica]|nr:LuxR family transcriptional regulator [Salmonella enterica]EFV4530983.1 helix-turn-helix transcriptional regulator [Salmonella enterica]EFW6053008.1 helix-turn-helix transcriptional regulator [Salmonella enterica]EHF3428168.1 helix-turn-helix transcriptional regulator [Salmonella enterica]